MLLTAPTGYTTRPWIELNCNHYPNRKESCAWKHCGRPLTRVLWPIKKSWLSWETWLCASRIKFRRFRCPRTPRRSMLASPLALRWSSAVSSRKILSSWKIFTRFYLWQLIQFSMKLATSSIANLTALTISKLHKKSSSSSFHMIWNLKMADIPQKLRNSRALSCSASCRPSGAESGQVVLKTILSKKAKILQSSKGRRCQRHVYLATKRALLSLRRSLIEFRKPWELSMTIQCLAGKDTYQMMILR